MDIGRRWFCWIRTVRWQLAASFMVITLLPIVYSWGRTADERFAAKKGYLAGLAARCSDLVLWRRAVVAGVVLLVLQSAFGFLIYESRRGS